MRMQVNEADGVTLVALEGRFDIAGAQEVDLHFSALAGSATVLIVDMTHVSFLASMGVRTLMLAAKTTRRRNGKIALFACQENVEKVLRATGFDEIALIVPDLETAKAAL